MFWFVPVWFFAALVVYLWPTPIVIVGAVSVCILVFEIGFRNWDRRKP